MGVSKLFLVYSLDLGIGQVFSWEGPATKGDSQCGQDVVLDRFTLDNLDANLTLSLLRLPSIIFRTLQQCTSCKSMLVPPSKCLRSIWHLGM